MSAKGKNTAAKPSGPSTISLVLKAIGAVKSGNKGASRAAIANWILTNTDKQAGGHFNAVLRRCLAKALGNGVLKAGATAQRFKMGNLPKPVKKTKKVKKKKVVKKKKTKKPKKKATGKKKKAASKKKKPAKKTAKKANKKKKASKKGSKKN